MRQLGVRLLVWILDIAVNAIVLANPHQAFSSGSLYLDNAQFIVYFNAALIMGIYATDFVIVTKRKYMTRINIGEKVIKGEFHG